MSKWGGKREGAGRPASGSVRKSFWVPADLLARMDRIVKKTGETKGSFVSRAIDELLVKTERKEG